MNRRKYVNVFKKDSLILICNFYNLNLTYGIDILIDYAHLKMQHS